MKTDKTENKTKKNVTEDIDARFEKIKPDLSATRLIYKNFRKVDVGDGGWVYGEPDVVTVRAAKGHTMIRLRLLADDAASRTDALIAAAKTVADAIE